MQTTEERLLQACKALLAAAAEYDASWSVPQFLEDEPAVKALRAAITAAELGGYGPQEPPADYRIWKGTVKAFFDKAAQ